MQDSPQRNSASPTRKEWTRPGIRRRDFVAGIVGGVSLVTAAPVLRGAMPVPSLETKGLAEPEFRSLPVGSVKPEGWLLRQLRLQANGLTGHLDEFWPDVAQSQWFGGTAEGWERAPYWLDGFIPLAWVLNDAQLKARAKQRVDAIVTGQRADGWYAPFPKDADQGRYDLWGILLVNKVLVQYHEATGDATVLKAVEKNLRALSALLPRTPLFGWGKARWFEGLISVYYVYERTGEGWLLELARLLREQGFDYAKFYQGEEIKSPTPRRGLWTMEKHVVNAGMAVKANALAWRLSREPRDREVARQMIEVLDRFHGQATGMFSGDECLAGRNPLQGTELCAVVEMMYSLEQVLGITGEPAFGDRLEKIAFNALPATISPDMWSHQYDQQCNQVQCTVNPDHMWSTNGPDSNLFGLEPNYGCCTSNMHQGWPKFVANLWMQTHDGGIACVAYGPSRVHFESKGTPVEVALATDYPFREELTFTVRTERAVNFPLLLRVPSWAEGATLAIESTSQRDLKPGTFAKIEHKWSGTTKIVMRLPMKPKVTRRYNQAIAVERGPLVYSLKIEEEWRRINADKRHRELPHSDFEVRPATAWNYGLLMDDKGLPESLAFEEQPVGQAPFTPEGAGMRARIRARKLPNWKVAHGWAGEVPPNPQPSREAVEELTLLPYGCCRLRITEFPEVANNSK